MKYKAKWIPYSLNKEFWTEVLVGRTIKKLKYTKKALKSFVLDNGEEILIINATNGTDIATVGIENVEVV